MSANDGESTDLDLVRRARSGDTAAFCALVRRYERTMLALAYARTRCAATAADVVQDSVVRCWKKLADLREESKFAGWLATTVRHLAVNALRSPQRRLRLASGEQVLERLSVDDGTDAIADDDQSRALRAAIDALDEPNAAVLVLKYYEDLSSKEIAALLDMTPAAVDMRLTRARQALRVSLATTDVAREFAAAMGSGSVGNGSVGTGLGRR